MSEALAPLFQIHPTRRCNLRCLHCYSRSSPEERDFLTPESIAEALTDARDQGYRIAEFSGGEPVLYPGLGELLRHAKSLGMKTTVASNGMLLHEARLREMAKYTDMLAISLDGMPDSHDRMRNCVGAFQRMAESLEAVRVSRIPFGFVFTLTRNNAEEVEWAADFAAGQGAKVLRLHPLEETGRAQDTLEGPRPDGVEAAYVYPEAERLRKKWGNKLLVQQDVIPRDLMRQFPERFYAGSRPARWPANLAACVTPLVLEVDGALVPMGYGFSREYAIGNITERRLRDAAPEWMAYGYPRFHELCRRVHEEACQSSDPPFLNWNELLQARAAAGELIGIG
jgi:MoaA/NifB/PqqE/SkfB family radical SAM enzyme